MQFKRYAVFGTVIAVVAVTMWSAPVSGQTPTTTTTTAPPPTTTTTAPPATTTTTLLPPTTTSPPATTTTVPDVDLPGEHIQDGSMVVGARFENKVESDCQLSGSLAGQEMNLIRTETNNLGAIYGKANLDFGEVGAVLVQLGPLPTGVLAYRLTGACNQDMVALGGFAGTTTEVRFEGIGYGIFPNDFANYVSMNVQVTASGGEPTLNLQDAYDFLNLPRQ